MSKFPKTIAAVQKREKSLWEIGDALVAECGRPNESSANDGSYERLEAAAAEINGLHIEGYSIDYLRKVRLCAYTFSPGRRHPGVSFSAHQEAKTPDRLDAIIGAAGSKPVTRDHVRDVSSQLDEQQAQEYREEHGEDAELPPVRERPTPTQREVREAVLLAEVAGWANALMRAEQSVSEVSKEIEKKLHKLESIDVDYLVEKALTLANHATALGSIARKLQGNRRAHLRVVGE